MKRILSIALMYAVLCAPLASLGAQTQKPGVLTGAVVNTTGVITGNVASSSGRRLDEITMHLVDSTGSVVGRTVTTRNGEFSFPGIALGTYTVQCVFDGKPRETESVTLAGTSASVKMICSSDAAFWKQRGLLAGLGAAAAAIGAAAVIATGGDVSGSR